MIAIPTDLIRSYPETLKPKPNCSLNSVLISRENPETIQTEQNNTVNFILELQNKNEKKTIHSNRIKKNI